MKLPTPIKTDNPIPWCLSHLLRWPTLCLWSFSLNKPTSYLSLCLSPNSFCDETSRTWASLSPETRCVISVKRPWIQVPISVFRWVRVLACGFKSQSEVHGFSFIEPVSGFKSTMLFLSSFLPKLELYIPEWTKSILNCSWLSIS